MLDDTEAGSLSVPSPQDALAELEAGYQPFTGFGAWQRAHVDEPRWARYLHNLTRRVSEATEEEWADVQDRMLRAAALESGALDGLFPANPELTATVLARSIGKRGAAEEPGGAVGVVAECHRRALVLAGEAAADGRPVDANLMAVLQDVITEAQATYTVTTEDGVDVEVELPRRQYKPVSNYMVLPSGGLAAFTPAGQVAAEMERLTGEFASAEFGCGHPVVQAAYAHYALTAIHPFSDGNGRLARTVASIFLLRSAGVPLLVFADQWPSYYQALGYHALGAVQRADERQALVDYAAMAAMAAMDFAANLLAPRSLVPLSGGRPARRRRPPPTAVLDDGARGLLDTLAIEIREVLVSPPRGVRIAVAETRAAPDGHIEGAYRVVEDARTGRFGLRVAVRVDSGTGPAAADLEFVALASEVPHDLLPVALRETRSNDLLEVALADAYPLVLEPAALRIRLWAKRLLAEALAPIMPSPPIRQPGARRRQAAR